MCLCVFEDLRWRCRWWRLRKKKGEGFLFVVDEFLDWRIDTVDDFWIFRFIVVVDDEFMDWRIVVVVDEDEEGQKLHGDGALLDTMDLQSSGKNHIIHIIH